MKIIRTFAFATILGLSTLSAGCASWWQNIVNKSPVAIAQEFIDATNVIVPQITQGFNDLVPFLPPEQQANARKTWTDGVTIFNNAEQVLISAIQAVMDGKDGNIAGAIANVVAAVSKLEAIVRIIQNDVAANPSVSATVKNQLKGSPSYAVFLSDYMKRYGKK